MIITVGMRFFLWLDSDNFVWMLQVFELLALDLTVLTFLFTLGLVDRTAWLLSFLSSNAVPGFSVSFA